MKDTVVFDLDGTLANIDHRSHLVKRDKPDWDAFYESCDKDAVNEWCATLMGTLADEGFHVIIVSARRATEYEKTLQWLKDNHVIYDLLELLRPANDYTPDTELKKKWLDKFGKDRILFVVDDRQKVVDMWRREGLTCLQCYAWPEYKRNKNV